MLDKEESRSSFSDSAMKELSSLKSEMSSLAIEEANISDHEWFKRCKRNAFI